MERNFKFGKIEHLCGEMRIAEFYREGTSFISFPLRVVFRVVDQNEQVPVKMLVSVPKKRIKLAVNRNRIKRLICEAYRMNKSPLCLCAQRMNKSVYIAFNYVADESFELMIIEKKMKQAIEKLINSLDTL
jgi:ribonuclease P protein component